MAKKIVSVCDRCQDDGREEPAEIERDVTLNGQSVHLDLCTACDVNWFGPFATSVMSFGLPVSKPGKVVIPTSDKPFPCPVCPAGYNHSGTRAKHLRKAHPDVADRYIDSRKGRPPKNRDQENAPQLAMAQ